MNELFVFGIHCKKQGSGKLTVMEIGQKKEKILQTIMACLLLVSMFAISKNMAQMVMGDNIVLKNDKRVVVIDAGHGGKDPGKVGVNDKLEKEINLKIAEKLKRLLEANDITVVMTREGDMGLYEESDSNKKVADMKNRLAIMEETNPSLVISIHQNSFHQEIIKGGQVFYYTTSKEGEKIAKRIQNQFITKIDPSNHREAKGNDSYYLLRKTAYPIVIVECGFLSNWEEATSLTDSFYQERVAWAIHMGVLEYLNTGK